MTGGAGSQSVAARSAARPIAYRPVGAAGGASTGTGLGSGLGTGLATGLSFSPGQSLGMSMSPPRTSMIHSSGYSTMSTPSRAVSSSVSLTTMVGATGGGENSASGGEQVGPGVRFCHVGVVYEGAFYIFGGYDGTQRYALRLFGCRGFLRIVCLFCLLCLYCLFCVCREELFSLFDFCMYVRCALMNELVYRHRLNDFLRYRFDQNEAELPSPPSTLVSALLSLFFNGCAVSARLLRFGDSIRVETIIRCRSFSLMSCLFFVFQLYV